MSIKVKDNGYKEVLKSLTSGENPTIKVGVFGSKASEEHSAGVSVLDIANFHEFGLGNNPERSFVRGWAEENESAVVGMLKKEIQASVKRRDTSFSRGFDRIGLYCQSGIQQRISDGIPPPLAPSTVKRKGSSTPLIDTGQLRSSVTYQVLREDDGS